MTSVFARGRKLYAKVRDAAGNWRQVATGFSVGEEAKAQRWAEDAERSARAARTPDGPLTLAMYIERWLAARRTASINDDRTRLMLHVVPVLGNMLLADVRPRHLRDLILALRAEGHLAPTTIRQVSGLLHTVFKSAVIEELIATNPAIYERGVLPKKADKDPTWRHEAIYTRAEVEQLISDERVLVDRRVFYALKLLAALRHTEAATLTWAQFDPSARPLGAINLGKTKGGVPRRIPVHPTLARLLAAWRLSGWLEVYGRVPIAADLIVPTRKMTGRDANEAQRQLLADLALIGLRTTAGKERNRRGHDLRRTFITLARADGAIDSWLRWVTHGPRSSEMLDVYSSPPWEVLCTEVGKLRIELLEGRVIALVAGSGGAVVVQSVQRQVDAGEKERPLRDSKASIRALDDDE